MRTSGKQVKSWMQVRGTTVAEDGKREGDGRRKEMALSSFVTAPTLGRALEGMCGVDGEDEEDEERTEGTL